MCVVPHRRPPSLLSCVPSNRCALLAERSRLGMCSVTHCPPVPPPACCLDPLLLSVSNQQHQRPRRTREPGVVPAGPAGDHCGHGDVPLPQAVPVPDDAAAAHGGVPRNVLRVPLGHWYFSRGIYWWPYSPCSCFCFSPCLLVPWTNTAAFLGTFFVFLWHVSRGTGGLLPCSLLYCVVVVCWCHGRTRRRSLERSFVFLWHVSRGTVASCRCPCLVSFVVVCRCHGRNKPSLRLPNPLTFSKYPPL